jgi:tRNA (guanine26-N2/guanine27-N2)-dimethyltransferase
MIDQQEFVITAEEKTRLFVPQLSLTHKVPPKTPAFFNPSAKLNRDVSVLAYRVFASNLVSNDDNDNKETRLVTFADSFCGIGARALRVAVEVPEIKEIYANDINPIAIYAARDAAIINSVSAKCHFSVEEVNQFLVNHKTHSGNRFDIADLDPFGSPAPYIDCLLRAVKDGGLISVTATDTAVLCGIYPQVCLRKYYGKPLNNSFSNETALRLLLSLIALIGARLDIGVEPLFAHTNLHYLRVYAKLAVSSNRANKVHENIGYVQYCSKCGNRQKILSKEYAHSTCVSAASEFCNQCNSTFLTAGPLWTSPVFNKSFVKKMYYQRMHNTCDYHHNNDVPSGLDTAHKNGHPNNNDSRIFELNRKGDLKYFNLHPKNSINKTNKKKPDLLARLLETSLSELDEIPYYFRTDEISSISKTNPQPLLEITDKLVSAGFKASKTSLNPAAFKTDARIAQILDVVK